MGQGRVFYSAPTSTWLFCLLRLTYTLETPVCHPSPTRLSSHQTSVDPPCTSTSSFMVYIPCHPFIHPCVTVSPTPTRSLMLPIPSGTSLKGRPRSLSSPSYEARQLWTEKMSGIKATCHVVISSPCFGPCLSESVRRHPKLRGNLCRIYTAN